jgi:hypothetical protein
MPVVHSGGTVLLSCPLCTGIFPDQPIQFLTFLKGSLDESIEVFKHETMPRLLVTW